MKKIFKIIGLSVLVICFASGLYSVFIAKPNNSSKAVVTFDRQKYNKKIDSKDFENNYYKLGKLGGYDQLLRRYAVYQEDNKEVYYVTTSFALRDKEGNLRGPVARSYFFDRKNNEIYNVFPKGESRQDFEVRKITKAELEKDENYKILILNLYKLVFHEEFVLR